MLEETINYQDDKVKADLTVVAANSTHEFARWRLRSRANKAEAALPADEYLLRMWAYPDVAAVLSGTYINGTTNEIDRQHPITFEMYQALPDALLVQIEDAVYRLNSGWLVKPIEQQAADEKKAVTNSTAA